MNNFSQVDSSDRNREIFMNVPNSQTPSEEQTMASTVTRMVGSFRGGRGEGEKVGRKEAAISASDVAVCEILNF